jgi:hypothetical protein
MILGAGAGQSFTHYEIGPEDWQVKDPFTTKDELPIRKVNRKDRKKDSGL